MAVRAPDGRIIDAFGMSTEQDFLSRWQRSGSELTEIEGSEWDRVQSWGQEYSSSPVKVANRILKSMESLGLSVGSKPTKS